MASANYQTYIPKLLREWGIHEFKESEVIRTLPIKGGRRSGIIRGVLTSETARLNVVVKVVHPEYSSSQTNDPSKLRRLIIEYFKRECRIWATLGDHENIVPLLGFVSTAQCEVFPSLVMPHYDGGHLIRFVKQRNIDSRGKVKLMRDVASGLEHMHTRNPPAIHRDLKASNIIIEIIGDSVFRARIADFGSAKLAEMESEIHLAGGTSAPVSFSWTPPEYVKISSASLEPVIDYSVPTRAGDIWSFGCTFLEIFRGKNPWDGFQVETELLQGHHPPRPESCHIDDLCWNVMLVCWFQNPDRRPSASQLIVFLRKVVYLL